eukprot:TRINITY_DN32_c1_g3_i1.p1 TRINITY_DN32_c1_g3~~TRINITY_DN32_c1_g3_i1.p1  ORF type:complete len:1170 (+),score=112.81 TRINITY_DN32_c1_g3_i1:8588-12097(+)
MLLLTLNDPAYSQEKKVHLNFVKTSCTQSSDSLYFNVLKIENLSPNTLELQPKITFPECFNLLSRTPKTVKLQPGKTKHIPFRVSILKSAYSGKEYEITAQLLNENNNVLSQTKSIVNIRPRRDWTLEVDESELIFSGEKNTKAELFFRLCNLGNCKEKINVNIEIPEGFKPASSNRKKNFNIVLKPGRDSVISYGIVQKYKNQELNFSDRIKLNVHNDHNKYTKGISISSFSNFFNYSSSHEKFNTFIEYSRRSMNSTSEIHDELRTKGIIPLKNENKLLFSFNNYDLKNTEEFWERSYYQLIFEGKKFSGGIGQHYSNLLLDAYNPHGAFANWKIATSKKSEIELYASQGLDYNITSVAAGTQLFIDKILIKTSAGYNEDKKRKQNSKSAIFSAAIPISRKHKLNLNARGIEREVFKDSTYTQRGLQGNWSYFGKLTPRLLMNVNNRFQTKGFYSGNQADNELKASTNYQINQKSRLLVDYTYNTKTGGSSDYDIENHKLLTGYNFKTSQNQDIKTGLWLEEYSNTQNENFSEVKSVNLWMETSSRTGDINYSFSAMAGYRFTDEKVVENGEEYFFKNEVPNIALEGSATMSPFSLRCSYINGAQKGRRLSNRSDYNELRFSPSYRQQLFRDRILLELQADYDLDWVTDRKSINLRPKMTWQFNNDWTLITDAYISAYGERSASFSGNDFNTNFRISLRKDFNIGRKRKKDKYHKMEMVFYRDENKNGRKDKNEKGIEKSLIAIDKQREAKDEKYIRLSKLVSQKDGEVTYSNIPEGKYEVEVNQLADTKGYFNFEGNKMQVKLDKDTTFYIPYIKAYKMEMVFYRDENKNGRKDKNEKGIEKSLIAIDKQREAKDEKYIRLSKLVSQKDGEVTYSNIPEGKYEVEVNQLADTKGYFNFEGNKMQVKLDKDTTFYIPYIKAYKIEGKLTLKKATVSSNKVGQISKIKVTAKDSRGKTYSCLTNSSGAYQLPVAGKDKYIVSIHNPYGSRIKVNNNNTSVDFSENEVETVDFQFIEKRRRVNMKKSSKTRGKSSKTKEGRSKIHKSGVKNTIAKKTNHKKLNTKTAVAKKIEKNNQAKPTSNNATGSISKQKPIEIKGNSPELSSWPYQHYNKEKKVLEDYLVYGAFEFKSNAESYAAELKARKIPAILLFIEKKNLFYVCTYKHINH